MNFNYDYALQDVCRLGYTQYIDYYLNLGANINRGLYGACEGGHIDLVELIIEKGANLGNMGLYHACKGGNIKIVELMIDKGAKYEGQPIYLRHKEIRGPKKIMI